MKVKYINGISVVVFAFFIQGFCGMTSIPVLEVVVLILALWHCLSLVWEKGDGCLLEARKELLSLITKPVIVGLLLTFFLLALIDVGVNIVGSMVMVERLGWTMEEAMKASWVYAICHTIGLCLGTFFIRREHPIAYFRWHIIMWGVVMLLLVFSRLTPIVVFVLIGVMGMLCASIFRLMYSIALHGEKCENNLVSGVMITVIACGGLAASLIGQVADETMTIGCVFLACMLYLVCRAFDSTAEEKCRL